MTQVKQDGWVSCPPGELDQLAGRLRTARIRRALLGALGILVAAGALTVAAVGLAGGFSGAPSGGGACPSTPSGCQPAPCPSPTP
jgi:hypothetical protein